VIGAAPSRVRLPVDRIVADTTGQAGGKSGNDAAEVVVTPSA
jgi:hypothetical protein